jgi:biopolymer transport protein ExbD
MTPFVDIAFLILSFFIMATKFKPEEPVKVETPGSVSSVILEETNAMLITIDPENRVFVNISDPKDRTKEKLTRIITGLNKSRNLGLTDNEIAAFKNAPIIGVPFNALKGFLGLSKDQQTNFKQPGIPVLDSLNNELIWWVDETNKAFAGTRNFLYLVKGDNKSKFPTFEAVINAMRKNEVFKYNLVTAQEGAPEGTELYKIRNQ